MQKYELLITMIMLSNIGKKNIITDQIHTLSEEPHIFGMTSLTFHSCTYNDATSEAMEGR